VSFPGDDAAQVLVTALQATIRALEGGDILGAAAAVTQVTEACEQAARGGVTFSPEQLLEARTLHSRCESLAAKTQAGVVAAVLQSSTQRKATDAYGSNS
jgi:hypothetical protein